MPKGLVTLWCPGFLYLYIFIYVNFNGIPHSRIRAVAQNMEVCGKLPGNPACCLTIVVLSHRHQAVIKKQLPH